jgi:hypothetical protein
VQEGVFGLTRFYSDDQIRALRATRRQAAPKPAKKAKKGFRPKVKLKSLPRGRSDDEPPRSAASNGSAPLPEIHDGD